MNITATTAELFFQREGVTSKQIRKPENLPEGLIVLLSRTWVDQQNVEKFGSHIRKHSGMGFFVALPKQVGWYKIFVSHGTNGTKNKWILKNYSRQAKKMIPN